MLQALPIIQTPYVGNDLSVPIQDTRLIPNSFSADDVADLPEEEAGDCKEPRSALQLRSETSPTQSAADGTESTDRDCEEGTLVPEDIRISDNVFDIIMTSLRENVLQDAASSDDASGSDKDNKAGRVGALPNSETGFQGDCDLGCDLGGGAGGSSGDAIMKQSVCSQDSGVMCDTAGPSSLQR